MSTAVLLLVALCIGMCRASDKHNLYPRCASTELTAQASSGQTVILQRLPVQHSDLIIACIAADISTIGLSSETACNIAHQTDFAYRLFLEATYVDPIDGTSHTMNYDLKDVTGGSANRIHVRLPASGTFVLKFANQATSSLCILKARAMLEVVAGSDEPSSAPAPVLVSLTPSVLHTEATTFAYFLFQHIRETLGINGDVATLIDSHQQCSDATSTAGSLRLTNVLPSDPNFDVATHHRGDSSTLSVWKVYLDRTGTFRVCYQGAEVAMIAVYGGNPSYYTFESGQGAQGQVYVGRKITVRFHGYGLDTRPGGDQAKFVDEAENCEGGMPAGGVEVATDLGPSDDWGPNTKYTEWAWTLRVSGSYKVCYRRKDHKWVEVPSQAELGPGAIDFTDPPAGPIPTPTDPVTHQDCQLAPSGADNKNSFTSTILRVELSTTIVPAAYMTALSQALCLPTSAIGISRQKRTSSGLTLWIDIHCDVADASTKIPCNAQERKNYAVYLQETNNPLAVALMWKSVTQTSQEDIFAEDDAAGWIGSKHSGRAFALACVTLIVIVSIVVYGVLKYKEKQHYFIQFGVEDDDVDADDVDTLEINADGSLGTKSRHAPLPLEHIADATIELEE